MATPLSNSAKPIRVALVGHCGPDGFALRSAVRRAVPGAEFVSINDDETLSAQGAAADLLLVNRVLDGSFEDECGLSLIRRFGGQCPALMLVSNHSDAQAEAAQAGALPGFGKTDMNSERAAERLRAAVAGTSGIRKPAPGNGGQRERA